MPHSPQRPGVVGSAWLGAKPDISNNVGPVKLFLKTLLSFHLKEFFSFVFFPFFVLLCIDDHGSFVI
jgi:hypothetical protein